MIASVPADSPGIIPMVTNLGLHIGIQGQPFTGLSRAIVRKGFVRAIIARIRAGVAGFTTHKVGSRHGGCIAQVLLYCIGLRQEPRAIMCLYLTINIRSSSERDGQVVIARS